jgi:lipopolysaccharide transport system ATP-binding protein
MWALRDISFEVKQGEILGMIGRNGAGKSTLLKILSRVTAPTSGEIRVKGRIASLLEVGTGFHPELTGRENIFLNGAILGMTRTEVRQKLDEIVAFAEVEKFLDTPVKRYSSGMYVRLAFAVAAHLEPEILVVDEVLAVGDAQFQEKCLGKMKNVARGGRTILFVSHNLGSIMALCSRCVLLGNGAVTCDGFPADTVRAYVAGTKDGAPDGFAECECLDDRPRRYRSDSARFRWISLRDGDNRPAHVFQFNDSLRIQLGFDIGSSQLLGVEVFLKTPLGEKVAYFPSEHFKGVYVKGSGSVELVIPRLPLAQGSYVVDIGLTAPRVQWVDFIEDATRFSVNVSDPGGTGFNYSQDLSVGSVLVDHAWNILDQSTASLH